MGQPQRRNTFAGEPVCPVLILRGKVGDDGPDRLCVIDRRLVRGGPFQIGPVGGAVPQAGLPRQQQRHSLIHLVGPRQVDDRRPAKDRRDAPGIRGCLRGQHGQPGAQKHATGGLLAQGKDAGIRASAAKGCGHDSLHLVRLRRVVGDGDPRSASHFATEGS